MSLALVNLEKARLPAARPSDAFARGLAVAFRRAAEKMREITTDAAVILALESRNASSILADPRWRAIDAQLFVDLDAVLRAQVGRAGDEELRRVAREFGARKKAAPLVPSFDLRNPFTEDFVRRRGAELVTSISGQTRTQIREAVEAGFVVGVPVRTTARTIRNSVGLDPRLSRAVRARAEALAGSGLGDEAVDRLVFRYADGLLRYRSELIARTETIAASNQGTLDSWRQAERQELLPPGMQKRWIAALGSSRTCDICEELAAHEPVGIHEEFYSATLGQGLARPPSHPACRCTLGLVRA